MKWKLHPDQSWESVKDMFEISNGEFLEEKQFTSPTDITLRLIPKLKPMQKNHLRTRETILRSSG